MFSFFSPRSRVASPRSPRLARLGLESLEGRAVPATLSLSVTYGTGKNVTLSGDLTNTTYQSGQMINFSGQVTGMTMTDSSGHFSFTAMASALGTVTASCTISGETCNQASVTLTDEVPDCCNLSALEGTSSLWTFSGHVNYARDFTTLKLYFGGISTLTNVVRWTDDDGDFEFMIQLNGNTSDNGYAWVKAESAWGTQSEFISIWVHQAGT